MKKKIATIATCALLIMGFILCGCEGSDPYTDTALTASMLLCFLLAAPLSHYASKTSKK